MLSGKESEIDLQLLNSDDEMMQFPTIGPLTRSLICASTSSQPEAENNCNNAVTIEARLSMDYYFVFPLIAYDINSDNLNWQG
ncbi:hypothetical protein QZH41_001279 [Actinostola sp. cb2023]|nr:hypothetical protein QZH41_001279 [Actinostola sp. cb2023]